MGAVAAATGLAAVGAMTMQNTKTIQSTIKTFAAPCM